MQIYLSKDGEKRGPFTVYEVAEEVRSGRADGDTLGWFQGCEGWVRLEEMPAVSSIFVPPARRAAQPDAEEASARRARLAPERMQSSVRLWARLIDLFLLHWVVSVAIMSSGWMTVTELYREPHLGVQMLLAALLVLLDGFMISAWGATPGKWLLRVRVIADDGGKIPLGISFYRALTVWWRGVGLWFLPLSILTMALAQATLLSTGKTPWDRASRLDLTYGQIDRNRIFLIIGIFLILWLGMGLAFPDQSREFWEAGRKDEG